MAALPCKGRPSPRCARRRLPEHHWLLAHQRQLAAQAAQVEGADVDAVDQHRPLQRLVEALQQGQDGALAVTALAHLGRARRAGQQFGAAGRTPRR